MKIFGKCGKCSYKVLNPENDLEVIFDKGYYWHILYMTVHSYTDNSVKVDFPSSGKINRRSLLLEDQDYVKK
jgi:hypothetical protein